MGREVLPIAPLESPGALARYCDPLNRVVMSLVLLGFSRHSAMRAAQLSHVRVWGASSVGQFFPAWGSVSIPLRAPRHARQQERLDLLPRRANARLSPPAASRRRSKKEWAQNGAAAATAIYRRFLISKIYFPIGDQRKGAPLAAMYPISFTTRHSCKRKFPRFVQRKAKCFPNVSDVQFLKIGLKYALTYS